MHAMLRTVLDNDITKPDCEMDVSGELIASMDLGIKSVTWERVKQVAAKDTPMIQLVEWIQGGCLGVREDLPVAVQPYWGIRDRLRVCDGVPLYDERTIVPKELRQAVVATYILLTKGLLV